MLQVIEKYGGPGGSPTRDLRVRSATLYASELPAPLAPIVPQGLARNSPIPCLKRDVLNRGGEEWVAELQRIAGGLMAMRPVRPE